MKRANHSFGILGMIAMAVFAQGALAAVCISQSNGNWGDRNIWSCGHVPGNADTAVIANGTTVTLNRNYTVGILIIDAGGIINDNGNNLTVNGSITVNGAFGIQNSGNQGMLISAGNNAVISGTGTFFDTTLRLNAAATIAAGSNLTSDGMALIDTNGKNLTINGTVTGTNSANGNGNGGASGTTIIDVNGASTVTISATGVLNASGAMIMLNNSTSAVINNGTATLAAIESVTGGTWTQGASSALTMAQNTGNWAGNLNASATGNTVTYGTGVAPIIPVSSTYYNLFGPTCAQVAGLTILGTGPSCAPLAYYHMDEASWNGTANQVLDSSGNGNNAQSFNSASTDGTTPAIAGNPGTCRYGVFDNGTTITQGYVQTPLPNLTSNFTVTAWIRTTNAAASGQRILIDDQNNTGGYGISLGDGGTGTIRFYSRGITPVILDSTYQIANNAWYFVAAVADITNRKRTIYVYSAAGALLASTSDAAAFTGTWGTDAGPVSIGGETNASGESPASFHFRGNIDEVSVYPAALSQTALAAIATQTHVCAFSAPNHLEIDHPSGTGLTCTPSTLTIKACADAACTTAYTGGVTGTLSSTGSPMVNWSGGSGFSIPAGSGTVTKDVQVTTPGSTLFSAASSPVAAAATTCNFGAPSCTFISSDSGFLVSAPNHIAESSSTLTVQAVKKADNSLACVPAFANTSKSVNLKCAYSNPATGTLPVRVGGAALNASGSATAVCDGAGANVTLTFDATGTATPTLQYADVGQMNVSAAYTGTAGSLDAGLSMIGTGSFIVAPASFSFSSLPAGPIKAGNPFSATVTALNALGNTTPNFGKETSPGPAGVTLTSTLVSPAGGANPTPGNNVVPGTEFGAGGMVNDANGVATVNNLSWGEVGSISLLATLTNPYGYLGTATTPTKDALNNLLIATGTSATVGAFIPEHFDTAVVATATTPMPCPTSSCPALYNGFVYSGQPFSMQVTAKNLAGGTTSNYHSAYGLSNNVNISAWDALGSLVTQNPGSGTLAINPMLSTAFNHGVGTTSTQTYTFATSPTAPTNIFLRAADAVNPSVTSLRPIPSASVEGGVQVVSGKVKVSNAHGSETLDLPMNASIQYYDGTFWRTSLTDSVTNLTLSLSNYQRKTGAWTTTPSPASGQVVAGILKFILSAPTGGGTGSVDVSISAPGYLLAGSNGAGVNPSKPGRATFGVYKGSSEFIYQREDY
ncbi:MAG TPA: DUF6701 domain-containing protein [Gallionella sp.]|nr:DUF6701 domain-containing protein [Gallionella sp.]